MGYVRPRCLDADEIQAALLKLKDWSGDSQAITRTIIFSDFREAIRFMQACVEGIEQRDHHPNWCNVYNSCQIRLNTHIAGNRVTEKDVDLAEFLDSVLYDPKQGFRAQ